MNGGAGQDRPAQATKPIILIVCTGNVCRSPAAELLLVHMLGARAECFDIRSAGTAGVVGAPIDPVMEELLGRRGIEAGDFRSRALDRRLLESADLILTATKDHGATAGRMMPSTVRRTMTLKRLARYAPFIAESSEPPEQAADRIAWLRAALPAARARAAETPRGNDDLADPRGGPRRRYAAVFSELERACAAIAPLLGPGPQVPVRSSGWSRTAGRVELSQTQREATWTVPQGEPAVPMRSFFEWAFKA